jgi:hypothetical protein
VGVNLRALRFWRSRKAKPMPRRTMPGVDLQRISLIRDRLQRGGTPGSGRLCDEGDTILELRPRFKQGMPGESLRGAAADEDGDGGGHGVFFAIISRFLSFRIAFAANLF